MGTIILASASPRRRELMALLPFEYTVRTAEVEETMAGELNPEENVMNLAKRKANAIPHLHNEIIIGCDTVVVLDDVILGKPKDEADATAMLRSLSGREHSVLTGVSILHPGGESVFCEKTIVRFKELTEEEITYYVRTGEPMDKAGAYGIQGKAAPFIVGITGDYFNVVGLPLARLYSALLKIYGAP